MIPFVFQAPSNMKAVLQAGWLLTVAVGNIIVLIVANASLQLQKVFAFSQINTITFK